jgi:hypothetical protein
MSSPKQHSSIETSSSSGGCVGGQHSSLLKRPRNGSNRSLFTVLVGVLAYASGVVTGILSNQSVTTILSAQSDPAPPNIPDCRMPPPGILTPSTTLSVSTSSTSTSTIFVLSSKLNMTMEENLLLKETQERQHKLHQDLEQHVRQLKQQLQQKKTISLESLEKLVHQLTRQNLISNSAHHDIPIQSATKQELPLFPDTVKQMVVDYATVPRDHFNEILDVGVPYDRADPKVGGEEVLLLYTTPRALPAVHSKTNKFGLNASEALENCNVVKVILHMRHDHRRKHVKQCIALVPNWDSYYVHNFQRLAPQQSSINITGERLNVPGKAVNEKYPLRYTSRNHDDDGSKFEPVPRGDWYTRPYYKILTKYLLNLNRILDEVKSFIKNNVIINDTTTTMNQKQTLVVMTVNNGQSVLFHNFVCHARKQNIDLSHVIMFATDETAQQLCHDLGIPAFYDETLYGDFPEESALGYGDATFAKMMLAKVICVHLILDLGYNVLFQDVDVLWFKVRKLVRAMVPKKKTLVLFEFLPSRYLVCIVESS